MNNPWSDHEVDLIVADYFEMLQRELSQQSHNKAEHRRALVPNLNSRSEGSIEFKHQNISACLIDKGIPYISGYKPRFNYQQSLRLSIDTFLEANQGIVALLQKDVQRIPELPTVESILSCLVDRPRGSSDTRRSESVVREPSMVNYVALEARNRLLGKAGEKFTVRFEQARLLAVHEDRLAYQVEHVAVTKGDGLGYDVLSFEPGGRERFIEVKTTKYGPFTPFYISRNELAVSRELRSDYFLYRIFSFRSEPRLFVLSGDVVRSCELEPISYRARLV